MSGIRFRKKAEADLRQIVVWYQTIDPDVANAILTDIYRSIDRLIIYPRSGMVVPGRRFRRIVTRKYHFKVIYSVEAGGISVIGIFRHQNRVI